MRRLFLIFIAGILSLTACNNVRKPSKEKLTNAINQYLAKHGEACTPIGRQFPVDVPESEQRDQYGIGPELAALEQAGLVHSSNAVVAIRGIFGSSAPQPVKRYELTDDGKKYFRQISGTFGQTGGFCYGQKTVNSIVKWTEPVRTGSSSQTEVSYTYKILNLPSWAERPDIQRAFPDVRATVNGASKTNQIAGLQLTNKGWEVPEQ